MDITVQIRKKGQFTIPALMRKKLGIEENEIVTVSMLGDDAIVIIPQKLEIRNLVKDTAALAKKRNISIEEMLVELDEIRHNL